jgi:hypothetical protein
LKKEIAEARLTVNLAGMAKEPADTCNEKEVKTRFEAALGGQWTRPPGC